MLTARHYWIILKSALSFGLGASGGALVDALNLWLANLHTSKPEALDYHQLGLTALVTGVSVTIAHLARSPLTECQTQPTPSTR